MKLQTFKQNILKPLSWYVAGLLVVFVSIWLLLGVALPEFKLNLMKAMSTAFGLDLPDNLVIEQTPTTMLVTMGVTFLAIMLLLIHVIFEAVVTERLINPSIDMVTSTRGALSSSWNPEQDFILIRMVSFHAAELLDVSVKAVLAVHEQFELDDGELDDFITYFPVTRMTPENVLVLSPRTPWSIAIPAELEYSNSRCAKYRLNAGKSPVKSFRDGAKPVTVKRWFDILISGTEPRSYAKFVIHRRVEIDAQKRDGAYELALHKGDFKSLPLYVESKEDVEQYC